MPDGADAASLVLVPEISDQEYELAIKNPGLIPSEAIAERILERLHVDLETMNGQIDIYTRTAASLTGQAVEQGQNWVNRVSRARAHKITALRAVERRLKDLRRQRVVADQQPDPAKAALKLASQQRIAAEAAARAAKKEAERDQTRLRLDELNHRRSVNRQFVQIARRLLDQVLFDEIMAEAKALHASEIEEAIA